VNVICEEAPDAKRTGGRESQGNKTVIRLKRRGKGENIRGAADAISE